MVDEMTVRRRVAGREQAKAYLEMLESATTEMFPEMKQAMWEEIIKAAPPECLPEPVTVTAVPAPFTPAEAQRFGQERMTFGKHMGDRIDQVPLDYLAWLADTSGTFIKDLRRYLASERIRREREAEDDGYGDAVPQ